LIKTVFRKYFELIFWIVALVCLALTNPAAQGHFTLCPLKLLGIAWCPGCGLGHAISFLLHGDLKSSFHAHWLGLPVLLALIYRIFILIEARRYQFGNSR